MCTCYYTLFRHHRSHFSAISLSITAQPPARCAPQAAGLYCKACNVRCGVWAVLLTINAGCDVRRGRGAALAEARGTGPAGHASLLARTYGTSLGPHYPLGVSLGRLSPLASVGLASPLSGLRSPTAPARHRGTHDPLVVHRNTEFGGVGPLCNTARPQSRIVAGGATAQSLVVLDRLVRPARAARHRDEVVKVVLGHAAARPLLAPLVEDGRGEVVRAHVAHVA